MKELFQIFIISLFISCSHAQEKPVSCEWCGANEAPENINSNAVIAAKSERGNRIRVSGTVYHTDRVTPAKDVILYLYHTNIDGIYPKRGNETGNGKRHGHLRGWIKTGKDGTYSFETIKPEPYPGRTAPAHIHITVKEPDKKEYWIKDFFFDDDKLLSSKDRKNETGEDRFNHVLSLRKEGPFLVGERDLLLEN